MIIDTLIVKSNIERRLADSIEMAINLSEGLVIVDIVGVEERQYSTKFSCSDQDVAIEEISPRMFSQCALWSCPTCNGLGFMNRIDSELVVPNKNCLFVKGQ